MDTLSRYRTDAGAIRDPRRSVRFSLARRSVVRATVAALLVLGVAAPAAAAGLGGLGADSVSADTSAIGSCDSDGVRVEYQVGASTSGRPTVTGVVLRSIHPSCTGSTVHLTVSGAGNRPLGTGTARVTGSTQTITLPTPVDATAVTGTALVITG